MPAMEIPMMRVPVGGTFVEGGDRDGYRFEHDDEQDVVPLAFDA